MQNDIMLVKPMAKKLTKQNNLSLIESLELNGLQARLVYDHITGNDASHIYSRWLELMSPYKKYEKLYDVRSGWTIFRVMAYNGCFGENYNEQGFEMFVNDCDDTGKLYLICAADFKTVKIFEIRPAAKFCEKYIGEIHGCRNLVSWLGFKKLNTELSNSFFYEKFIWNPKKNKCFYAECDYGIQSWYFG